MDTPTPLRTFTTVLWKSLKAFSGYQGMNQAAALAFYALLSFIPLLFLVIAVAGMIWGDPDALKKFIMEQQEYIMPTLQQTLKERVDGLLTMTKGLGIMSIIFIAWTSGLFFSIMQSNLRLPWTREYKLKRNWLNLTIPWILGPAFGFLLPVAMLSMHLVGYFPWHLLPFRIIPEFWTWLFLSLLLFLLYIVFLPQRISIGVTAILSLVLSGASQGLTNLFVEIISGLPNYSMVYGSLAGIVLFLLWLDYNMAIILWGGHFIRIWGARNQQNASQQQ